MFNHIAANAVAARRGRTGDPVSKRVSAGTMACLTLLGVAALALGGCGGMNTPVITPPVVVPPSLLPISFTAGSGGGNGPIAQTLTLPKAEISPLTNLAAAGINGGGCTIHAGTAVMNFSADASSPWFTIAPTFGTVQPNGSTGISVIALDARLAANGLNTGSVNVSAPGYASNSHTIMTLTCGATDSQGRQLCTISMDCR